MVRNCIFSIIAIVIISCIMIINNYIVILPNYSEVKIGVIDDSIINRYTNVIYSGNVTTNEKHGNQLVDCLLHFAPKAKIYYYSAENNGRITSEDIIKGIEWMKNNDVQYINISLSSKEYSSKLNDIILENKGLKIFCSFNNYENTYDYPAMYNNVYGVGLLTESNKNEIDIIYKSNRVIIMNKGINYYEGNSFISLVETFKASFRNEEDM